VTLKCVPLRNWASSTSSLVYPLLAFPIHYLMVLPP
jgi:hypothetical protein